MLKNADEEYSKIENILEGKKGEHVKVLVKKIRKNIAIGEVVK